MRKKGSLTIAILVLAVLALIPVLSACDHTHTPVHMEAFEGSCTEQGNIECWYCSIWKHLKALARSRGI